MRSCLYLLALQACAGRTKRCWCVLVDKTLLFYKRSCDKVHTELLIVVFADGCCRSVSQHTCSALQAPSSELSVDGARVQEVEKSAASNSSDSEDTQLPEYTLAILRAERAPVYLLIATRAEKDSWLYHLSIATGSATREVGTDYEQLIGHLKSCDGDVTACYWNNPLLLHSREALTSALTTLPHVDLQPQALQLFKVV